MSQIKQIISREIIDSRGNPTIETKVILNNDIFASASIPSGSSIGQFEAVELRDEDNNRYHGAGVLKAVNNVNNLIGPKLAGFKCDDQRKIDQYLVDLDGSVNKKNLGSNTLLSISLAIAKVSSILHNLPLYKYLNNLSLDYGTIVKPKIPVPIFNIINGGKHGFGNLDFQEFQIIPASYKPFSEQLRSACEIYWELKKVFKHRNINVSVGDEGGFSPNLFTNLDALEIIKEAILKTIYRLGQQVFFGLDIAANYFKQGNRYLIKDKTELLNESDLLSFYLGLINEYHFLLIEDPFSDNDWTSFAALNSKTKNSTLIVGDDFIATNMARLRRAILESAISGVIIKPNQIGTLSETLEVISLAKKEGIKTIVSHRSGETTDTFIADLAVAVASDYVKFGAPARGERTVKYNRLLEIENGLKEI